MQTFRRSFWYLHSFLCPKTTFPRFPRYFPAEAQASQPRCDSGPPDPRLSWRPLGRRKSRQPREAAPPPRRSAGPPPVCLFRRLRLLSAGRGGARSARLPVLGSPGALQGAGAAVEVRWESRPRAAGPCAPSGRGNVERARRAPGRLVVGGGARAASQSAPPVVPGRGPDRRLRAARRSAAFVLRVKPGEAGGGPQGRDRSAQM